VGDTPPAPEHEGESAGEGFARLVSLACHDLRTPLATVNGVAKMLARQAGLPEREARLAAMADAAAEEMASLLDRLGLAARIAAGRYEPHRRDADTRALASAADERITVAGDGELVSTDVDAVSVALADLARAALRHGGLSRVTWTVTGATLVLTPVVEQAAPVVEGSSPRELGPLVARMVIEALGGSVALEGEALRVELA
jgi:signal transduction histidine kinase